MTDAWNEFCHNGFHVARGLLRPEQAQAVLDSIHRSIAAQLGYLGASDPAAGLHEALRRLHRLDLDRYKRTLAALWRKADVSALMRDPAIFGFLRQQLGWQDVFLPGGEVALLMAADLKIPGGYFGLAAHQDFPSVQGSLDGVIAWIPLTPVDADGWTIEVSPGSHRRGLIQDVERTAAGWQILPALLDSAEWQPVEAAVGDVVFLSVFTIHRSKREGDERRLRLALSTRFDNADEPSFVARAYPTAYQRSVHRDLYQAGFPAREQLAQVFTPNAWHPRVS